MRRKPVQLVTGSVELLCPHCGEPQPSPGDGSHLWLIVDVTKAQGAADCVACDEPITIVTGSTAKVSK